jgi:hypothetical protein
MMQFPETATLVESVGKSKGFINVHAVGCVHTRMAKAKAAGHGLTVMDVTDPADMWPQALGAESIPGVEGAVKYFLAIRSGLMDDGTDNGAWSARLAPCAKKEI